MNCLHVNVRFGIYRQDRAPLESSNTSNCVHSNNNQLAHAAAATNKVSEHHFQLGQTFEVTVGRKIILLGDRI